MEKVGLVCWRNYTSGSIYYYYIMTVLTECGYDLGG